MVVYTISLTPFPVLLPVIRLQREQPVLSLWAKYRRECDRPYMIRRHKAPYSPFEDFQHFCRRRAERRRRENRQRVLRDRNLSIVTDDHDGQCKRWLLKAVESRYRSRDYPGSTCSRQGRLEWLTVSNNKRDDQLKWNENDTGLRMSHFR